MNSPAPLKLERVSLEELVAEATQRELFAAHNGRLPDVSLLSWLSSEEARRSEELAAWSVAPVVLGPGGAELAVGSWYDAAVKGWSGGPPRSQRGLRYAGRIRQGRGVSYRFEHYGAAGSGYGRAVLISEELLAAIAPVEPSEAQVAAAAHRDAFEARVR